LTKFSETSSPGLPAAPFWEDAAPGGAAKTGIEPATIVAQHARTMARTVSREEALYMVSFMVVGTLARAPA
jgi:hypothetical protein